MKLLSSLLVCAVALLPLVAAQVPIPYSNCGGASDHIKIVNATADSWPPVAGTHVMLTIDAVLDEPLMGGSYSAHVSLDGLPIINQAGSLSNLPGITYPIPAGPITIAKKVHFPALLGGSSAVLNVSASDPNGQELLCIGIAIYLVPASKAEQQQQPELAVEEEVEPESLFEVVPAVAAAPRAAHKNSFQSTLATLLSLVSGESRQLADVRSLETAVASTGVVVPVTNCGAASDLLLLQSVTSTEWPPAAGTTATVIGSFIAENTITSGTYTVLVSVDSFPLINTSGDLADFLTFPIPAGPMVMEKNVTLPATLPFTGAIGVKLSALNAQSQEIFCLALDFTI